MFSYLCNVCGNLIGIYSIKSYQAYHSQIREYNSSIGNMAILPLRTQSRGPAPSTPNIEQDVIDESLYYFKANVFFRTYEIKVGIERCYMFNIIYLI